MKSINLYATFKQKYDALKNKNNYQEPPHSIIQYSIAQATISAFLITLTAPFHRIKILQQTAHMPQIPRTAYTLIPEIQGIINIRAYQAIWI